MTYRRPTQVLVYAVRQSEDGGRYLLLHRIPARGAFWQGVTGGAEWGEELPDAALRELFEETGLRPVELRRIDCSYVFAMQDEWQGWYAPGTEEIEEHVFLAIISVEEPVISSEEHDDWRLCAYEEALAQLKWTENIKALRCCQHALESASHPV